MYRRRVNYYLDESRSGEMSLYKRGFFIFLGACLVSISLELFLVENYIIDGGMVGISIIISHFTHHKVSSILLLLNSPFLVIGYHYMGRRFLLLSLFSIFSLAFGTSVLEPYSALTNHPMLVIVIGGICLGLGVGTVIRFGASLDGTEVLAILFSKQSPYTIGQYILLFNIFIFGSAIFVFGMKEAIYSLATFFVAYKTIDLLINM
ncbi:YitT family protein [Bacillus sp. V3B]|uniref:YitT family protein n=1 Tax=Bacillus sp. V3B TaxID=2804915 RepID=UPI00210E6686|nr:YitT family protein [Bacillus sp. V3B]MCQ6274730.1 YitT family protein [Bacillus sp. V3B]